LYILHASLALYSHPITALFPGGLQGCQLLRYTTRTLLYWFKTLRPPQLLASAFTFDILFTSRIDSVSVIQKNRTVTFDHNLSESAVSGGSSTITKLGVQCCGLVGDISECQDSLLCR